MSVLLYQACEQQGSKLLPHRQMLAVPVEHVFQHPAEAWNGVNLSPARCKQFLQDSVFSSMGYGGHPGFEDWNLWHR